MTSAWRSAWDLPRAPAAPARVWRDWVLVGGLAVLAIVEGALRTDVVWVWPSVVVELGLISTLLWRRSHPSFMVIIAFGVSTLFDAVRLGAGVPPVNLYTMAFMLILVYALVRWGSGRELIVGGSFIVFGIARALLFGTGLLTDVIGGLAFVTASATLGAVFRYRAMARVERLEQVRLHERERLARDLHDTVAHHVSAIALRAQAGLATADPTAALRVIESEASEALREMRSMVRVLRDEQAATRTPTPGVAQLHALATAGGTLPVSVHVVGELAGASAPITTAVYRVAQESVTNARAHAQGATHVEIVVTVAESITVRVHDDGATVAPRVGSGSGFGIVGMTERAVLLGGTLVAGPDPAGGWTVTAGFPS